MAINGMAKGFFTTKKIAAQAGLTAQNANSACIFGYLSLLVLCLCLAGPSFAQTQEPAAACAMTVPPGQKALLYVWSPRMVLSVQHAGAVRRQARSMGLLWQPMHDASVDAAELQAALDSQNHGAQRANYRALKDTQPLCNLAWADEHHALRHFPTAYVLYQHRGELRIAGETIVGAMPLAYWRLALQQRLELAKVTRPR